MAEPSDTTRLAAPPRRGALGAWVADQVAGWIASSGRRAGDPLPAEAELAQTYGVSVRVVRDALRILGSQGVIETSQGRRAVVADRPSAAIEGYFKFVTTSDDRAIAELFEVRTALETRAAGLAAGQASGDEISAIAEALAAMRAASDRIDAYAEADLAWHSAVVRGSHNRFLIGIHAALAEVLRSERIGGVTMRFRAGDPATKTLDEHAAITHAIANGDGASAQGLMLDHLERARQLYATYLASRDSLRRGSEQRR